MTKTEFLTELEKQLYGLPSDDIKKSLDYYAEMIDDRIEDGMSESEAVAAIGNTQDIAKEILMDIPLAKLVKTKIKPKRTFTAWEIALLILGSPIWISLLLAAFAVVLSVYVVLWSVIISLWALFVSFVSCALGGIVCGICVAVNGNGLSGGAMIGASIVCAGLAVFMFYGCKAATKGILILTKKVAFCIKNCFVKKEEA